MGTVLLTGANRGIGLEFVRQYAADGWSVIACCRSPASASALASIKGHVAIHALDVADVQATARLGEAIEDGIDVVIANAGIGAKDVGDFGAIDYGAWDRAFAVNVRGALATAEAFAPHLKKAEGKLAFVSSLMGSIEDASRGAICYRATKAALNMVAKLTAAELSENGVSVAPFHPGWVKTEMGGPGAPVTVVESVAGLRRRIMEMSPTAPVRLVDYTGKYFPW
ncbi:MAG: SDR family NAD(P)-dependent oxidoreductase [Alphaproteobacteria bacterium]|nr:SDR family NAD(P)-dependent oxidoreductase [Alphaproteobacteria bacterium]